MLEAGHDCVIVDSASQADGITEVRRQAALLKTGALQNAILTSANFSIIATDEKGIIQLFNVGAERMLGYQAAEVVNRISPSDMHDPREVMARAQALSLELATPIAPGFEALSFKASRGIEDIYELTYICKDGHERGEESCESLLSSPKPGEIWNVDSGWRLWLHREKRPHILWESQPVQLPAA